MSLHPNTKKCYENLPKLLKVPSLNSNTSMKCARIVVYPYVTFIYNLTPNIDVYSSLRNSNISVLECTVSFSKKFIIVENILIAYINQEKIDDASILKGFKIPGRSSD